MEYPRHAPSTDFKHQPNSPASNRKLAQTRAYCSSPKPNLGFLPALQSVDIKRQSVYRAVPNQPEFLQILAHLHHSSQRLEMADENYPTDFG
jgi:hypothetical protein